MANPDADQYHKAQTRIAAELYSASLSASSSTAAWTSAKAEARKAIVDTIRETEGLSRVSDALMASGKHARVLRQLLTPPLSQDQFKLLCPAYSKAREKNGSGLSADAAQAVEASFESWRDRRLTLWLSRGRPMRRWDVERLLSATTPLFASQIYGTKRRNESSATQELAVVDLLLSREWQQLPSKLVDKRASLSANQFMRKTRFATTTRPQEVDVACGLGSTMVLAMECKVSNDETNSVKRVNDVLKKAAAWKEHWGSFVLPAAMMQGVIAFKEIERLLSGGVLVFWSHDLKRFEDWIDAEVAA